MKNVVSFRKEEKERRLYKHRKTEVKNDFTFNEIMEEKRGRKKKEVHSCSKHQTTTQS